MQRKDQKVHKNRPFFDRLVIFSPVRISLGSLLFPVSMNSEARL